MGVDVPSTHGPTIQKIILAFATVDSWRRGYTMLEYKRQQPTLAKDKSDRMYSRSSRSDSQVHNSRVPKSIPTNKGIRYLTDTYTPSGTLIMHSSLMRTSTSGNASFVTHAIPSSYQNAASFLYTRVPISC